MHGKHRPSRARRASRLLLDRSPEGRLASELGAITCRLTEGLSWIASRRGCQQRHPVLPA